MRTHFINIKNIFFRTKKSIKLQNYIHREKETNTIDRLLKKKITKPHHSCIIYRYQHQEATLLRATEILVG